MQIAETLNQGLRREFSLVIPASDLQRRVDARLAEVSKQIRMPGFRPGKVPPNLVRKMHGAALHGEAVQAAVNDGVQQLLSQRGLRPAVQPQVELEGEAAEGADVALKVALEVLPTIETVDIENIRLERLVVPVDAAEVEAALERLARQQQKTESAPEGHAAREGDTVVIDFAGTVDGAAFEGGTGQGMRVQLGSDMLIPGFEAQLLGAVAGEVRTLRVDFPADYGNAALAGRPATFEVTVTAVETPVETPIDDEFARSLGIDTLAALREILKDQIAAETAGLTRTHLKRKLLDTLAARHDFEVPPSMVRSEFEQIWSQLEQEAARAADPAAARAEIEAERADYERIAERRVRLGLLLSEIGARSGVTVTQSEMNRLIGQEAARYAPAEQHKVVRFFQENPAAAAQLRAPLYEDKVVDYLLGKAEIVEREVTRAALEAAIEDQDETPAQVDGPDPDHAGTKPARSKPAAAKAGAAADDKPAKKAAKPRAARAGAEPAAVAGDAGGAEATPARSKAAAKKAAGPED